MTLGQVPLVVSWIAAIDPDAAMNEIEVAARMERELIDAGEAGVYHYFIGYFERLATFFMVGARLAWGTVGGGRNERREQDYEIVTLLVSPVITEDLYLPLFHQAIGFVFESERVDRVICKIEVGDELRGKVLRRLGFYEVEWEGGDGVSGWYGCSRERFWGG